MRRHYKLGQLLNMTPLFIIPRGAADHIFKFDAILREGFQVINGEYLVKTLFKSLNLNLQALMEEIVHCQIDVIL